MASNNQESSGPPAPSIDTTAALPYSVASLSATASMRQVIHGYVRPEDSGYLAQCFDLPITLRADSLQEAVERLHREIQAFLEGKNLMDLGFDPHPKVLVTFHFGPANCWEF